MASAFSASVWAVSQSLPARRQIGQGRHRLGIVGVERKRVLERLACAAEIAGAFAGRAEIELCRAELRNKGYRAFEFDHRVGPAGEFGEAQTERVVQRGVFGRHLEGTFEIGERFARAIVRLQPISPQIKQQRMDDAAGQRRTGDLSRARELGGLNELRDVRHRLVEGRSRAGNVIALL